MNFLNPDKSCFLTSEDPKLPCGQSSSNDSLLDYKENLNPNTLKKEEKKDWDELLNGEEDIDVVLIGRNDGLDATEVEIGPSASWNDFYQSLREESSIQEIILPESNGETSEPAYDPLTERKKYQRFREKKFVCDECDRCFTLKQNVQQHLMIYHMNGSKQLKMKRGKRYKCLKCDQVFKTMELAQKHDRSKHGQKTTTPRVFRCDQCPKVYPTSSALKEHISIYHLNERPHECIECGVRFGRKGGLRRHMLMVHENQLYKCPYEDCTHPGYKCTKALSAHIRSVHTKIRPFRCMMCDRTFVRKNDLKTHEMTHQATATLVCTKCSKTFKRIPGFRAHKKKCLGMNGVKKEEEEEDGDEVNVDVVDDEDTKNIKVEEGPVIKEEEEDIDYNVY